MKPLSPTPELLKTAERVVWFKEPAQSLADPIHFMAHVMTYGTMEDIIAAKNVVGDDGFTEVLNHPPAGIFDARSWAYWNTIYGREPIPPMPTRTFT